jgi:hypothetical protein
MVGESSAVPHLDASLRSIAISSWCSTIILLCFSSSILVEHSHSCPIAPFLMRNVQDLWMVVRPDLVLC